MTDRLLRRLTYVYPLLMLLCGLGYTRWDNYQMDGDAVSFVDISHAVQRHDWGMVLNGYWNPAYAFLLAAGNMLAHPTRAHELQINFYVNFCIFAVAIVAVAAFVRAAVRFRESLSGERFALSQPTLLIFAWTVIFYSWQRELSLGKVRSDALLFVFFVLAATLVLRLFTRIRMFDAALLGLALGGAYLTKSFGFVASVFLLTVLVLCGLLRKQYGKKMVAGAVLAGAVFLLVCSPYIAGISRQRDRLTFGDSSRLLYAWVVGGTGTVHEWHVGPVSHATLELKHHDRLLMDNPSVYSYDEHLVGTFPIWFDPAWWHDKTTPHMAIEAQIKLLARNLVLDVRFLEEHPEPLVLLFVLFLIGCRLPSRCHGWLVYFVLMLWALFMIGLYTLLVLEHRYLVAPWLFLTLLPAAMLRTSAPEDSPSASWTRMTATALVLLLAGLCFTASVRDLAQRRRALSPTGHPNGAYDRNIYGAAEGLAAMGIKPGDRVACIGVGTSCGPDPYWAWLAGVQTVADVDGPGDKHSAFWDKTANKAGVVEALRSVRAKALVLNVPPGEDAPKGWKRLGKGDFFACSVDPQPDAPSCAP